MFKRSSLKPLSTETQLSHRQLWMMNRFWMETYNLKTRRYGGKGHHHWMILYGMMKVLEWVLRLTGLYQKGVENAKNLRYHEINLSFEKLPKAFEGFTILHLSDLHLDGMEGVEQRIVKLIGEKTFDLCVITGDFRTRLHGPFAAVMDKLKTLLSGVRSLHGVIAVLGNHDGCHMVAADRRHTAENDRTDLFRY